MNDDLDQQERFRAMQDAEEAKAVMALAKPFLDNAVNTVVNELIRHYRSAEINHDFIVGKIGEINAVRLLYDNLTTIRRIGERAAEEEFKDGA